MKGKGENIMSISNKRLQEIENIRDEDIDYSGIPELDNNFWKNATLVESHTKKAISIRLDQDIIDYFKSDGRGYQSKINNILRTYVEAHHQISHSPK